jgi:hypothetical protein
MPSANQSAGAWKSTDRSVVSTISWSGSILAWIASTCAWRSSPDFSAAFIGGALALLDPRQDFQLTRRYIELKKASRFSG